MKCFQATEEAYRREHPALKNMKFLVGLSTFLNPHPLNQLNPDFFVALRLKVPRRNT
jgi:hypothetical protein